MQDRPENNKTYSIMTKLIITFLFSITMLVSCGGKSEPLAAPGNVPAGLETLKLTEGQAKDINEWIFRNPSPDPAEYAQYIESELRHDQMEAFNEMISGVSSGAVRTP